MRIVEELADFPGGLDHPVMAIGTFDGVHLGHRAILERLVLRATKNQGTSVLLTFSPHPQKVISPGDAPDLLQTREQKGAILAEIGVQWLLRIPFNRKLSLFTPHDFARQILHDHGIREIHVGSNFRFGHRRSGDIDTLRSLGEEFDFEVFETGCISFRGRRISSSWVREALGSGQVALARRLLGRPYRISGTVVRGDGAGAGLGFPTANLGPENELVPPPGVYVTRAGVNGRRLGSVTNIGFRPTLDARPPDAPVVETHILGFDLELYGKPLELDFYLRLRDEKRFPDLESLKKQIARDRDSAQQYFIRTGA